MGPRFLRYASAGAIGTTAHFAILAALVHLAGIAPVIASTAGAVAGALINYAVNHRFTFESRRTHTVALPRFFVVASAGVALNAIVMATLLALAPLHYLVAQAVATGIVLVTGYVANRRWTF